MKESDPFILRYNDLKAGEVMYTVNLVYRINNIKDLVFNDALIKEIQDTNEGVHNSSAGCMCGIRDKQYDCTSLKSATKFFNDVKEQVKALLSIQVIDEDDDNEDNDEYNYEVVLEYQSDDYDEVMDSLDL